jgi:HK97 family phage major capsid protein
MNIAQLERDLLKASGEAAGLLEKTMKACQAFEEKDKDGKVVANGRLMTDDEKKAIQSLIDDGNGLKARIERAKGDEKMAAEIERLTAGMSPSKGDGNGSAQKAERRSMGQQFIESEAGQWLLKTRGSRGGNWTSPSAELFAATLDTSTTSGGDLIVTQYRPGILPLLFKRLVVADLLASGTTDSNSVTYMKETTFTNAAAAVTEGNPKPESTLVFDQVNDLVQKIAHWLPVTDEMLEDVSQIRSYIDARLRLGVDITEEDQLLNGSGTAPNITGLLNRSGLTTATDRAGSVTNADAIFTAMMAVFNGSFVMPTGTILNPANWQTIQLSKDGNGNYYGSGPFAGAQAPTLWGLPVVVTPSIVANTGFTGAFNSAAQVFRKGGVRVEASNSHSDFFVRNLTAIRAEERLALAVYRPAAFSKITSLT